MNIDIWNKLPGIQFNLRHRGIEGYVKVTEEEVFVYCFVPDELQLPYVLEIGPKHKFNITRRGWITFGINIEEEKEEKEEKEDLKYSTPSLTHKMLLYRSLSNVSQE